jgi:single-strand DNA-binding protein
MSFTINSVFLTGNLTRDPEMRYTKSGKAVLNMSMATSKSYKNGETWEEKSEYHNITVWGKTAEYLGGVLVKGVKISVEGRLEYDEWEQDGNKRVKANIVAKSVIPMQSKPKRQPQANEEVIDPNSIPF